MNHLVFQTDFGLVDGAVSAMYGVAYYLRIVNHKPLFSWCGVAIWERW